MSAGTTLPFMKVTIQTTFTDAQLKEIFNAFSISDCKRVISFLQKRITTAEEQKRLAKGGLRLWDDDFLNMPIEEFELHPRIRNLLRENELNTVRDITDLGIDKLAMFRGFGGRTIEEVKRAVFNNHS